MSILLIEPRCAGNVHVQGNAAFLAAVALAFPEESLEFCAEGRHERLVHDYLQKHAGEHSEKVKWHHPILSPLFDGTSRLSWTAAFHRMDAILAHAHRKKCRAVFFLSLSGLDLLALKLLLARRRRSVAVLAVLHTNLARIRGSSLHYKTFVFRKALLGGNHRMRYLVLAPAIRRQALELLPELEPVLAAIDQPYFFEEEVPSSPPETLPRPRFGFVGTTTPGKGYSLYLRLVSDLAAGQPAGARADQLFTTVGYDPSGRTEATPESPGTRPLEDHAYGDGLRALDYFVLPYSANRYSLTMSGCFLDSLSFIKPAVVLSTPVFEDYFARLGDIGHLCRDYEELRSTVAGIISAWPYDRYRSQQARILEGRGLFTPRAAAPAVRELLGQIS